MKKIKKKPVVQMTKDGEVVKRWKNHLDAASELGLDARELTKAIGNSGRECGGFIWLKPQQIGKKYTCDLCGESIDYMNMKRYGGKCLCPECKDVASALDRQRMYPFTRRGRQEYLFSICDLDGNIIDDNNGEGYNYNSADYLITQNWNKGKFDLHMEVFTVKPEVMIASIRTR